VIIEAQKFIAKLFPRATVSPSNPLMRTAGIHHITAIAGDPARNLAFYTEGLGLRLVKRTVNFDDPGSYHLYFGDEIGRPGTIITFFLWPGAQRGTRGSAEVDEVSFAIDQGSFEARKERLMVKDVHAEEIETRFGERALRFADPDGLVLQLTAPSDLRGEINPGGTSLQHDNRFASIRALAPPVLSVRRPDKTEKVLVEILGFEFAAEKNHRRRFRGSGQTAASFIDIALTDKSTGHIAAGNVHHIAFRAADEDEQLRWREQLIERGFNVSPVMDRKYFRSIYFREPSGILFEIATDGPGFTVDETPDALGHSLQLPAAFEPKRTEIERALPPLETAAAM
jgi:glyoxalase family protein